MAKAGAKWVIDESPTLLHAFALASLDAENRFPLFGAML
jgi:hypothetical protein